MDEEIPVLKVDDSINFWLVRANGGKYYQDFLNNDYVGIKYNLLTVKDINRLSKQNRIMSSKLIKDLMFEKYKKYSKQHSSSSNSLKRVSKAQLTMHANQAYLLMYGMNIGDVVFVPSKKSYKFAMGVIISSPYDESKKKIKERISEYNNDDINYIPSDYIKRRKILWISVLDRKDIPKELSWILNAHQAVSNLSSGITDKSKLFNMISPFYKYNDKYYLRVYTSEGGELNVADWDELITAIPKNNWDNISLRATVNSPGFFTFISANINEITQIFKFIPISNNEASWLVAVYFAARLLMGSDNLKKGVIEWLQDVYKKHLKNKLYKEDVKNKVKKSKVSNKLGLSIKYIGKPVEKNNSKFIHLPIDTDKNNSKAKKSK